MLEELARIHGYNKFPNTLPAFTGAVVTLPDEPKDAKVRETMLALGLRRGHLDHLHLRAGRQDLRRGEPLAIANPLSEEAGYMRTSMLPGLLNMVGYNLNRGNTDVRLFEAGEVFEKAGDSHEERRHLGFAATGDALAKSVHSAAQPYTFFHMKGDVEELLAAFQHSSLYFDAQTPEYLHPGRSARAVMDGETVARFGQLHPDLAAARKLRQEVYLAEVLLDRLYTAMHCASHAISPSRSSRPWSATSRSSSTMRSPSSASGRRSRSCGISELQKFVPAEIYRGEKVGAGKYSALLHAEFQSKERTLRDDEVAQWSSQIIAKLESLGGVLRA